MFRQSNRNDLDALLCLRTNASIMVELKLGLPAACKPTTVVAADQNVGRTAVKKPPPEYFIASRKTAEIVKIMLNRHNVCSSSFDSTAAPERWYLQFSSGKQRRTITSLAGGVHG